MWPSPRLDLLLVANDPGLAPEVGSRLVEQLRAEGVIGASGAPGPHAARWAAGFRRVWLDDPGTRTLYANIQGGFRVRCPRSPTAAQVPVARAFEAGLTGWRAGGPDRVTCPACSEVHPLHAFDVAPPIAIGRFAIVTSDVEEPDLAPTALALVRGCLGETRLVPRRG